MHTSRFSLILLLTMIVVSGCRSREPEARMLPDTPDAAPSRAAADDRTDGVMSAEVRRLRDRIEAQDKLFAGAGEVPPSPRTATGTTVEPTAVRGTPPPRSVPPSPIDADPVWAPRPKPSAVPLRPQPEPKQVPAGKPPVVPVPEPAAIPSPRPPAVAPASQPSQPQYATPYRATDSTATSDRDALEREFDKRATERPADAVAHLNRQLLRLLLDRPVPTLATMTSLPADDRDAIVALLDAITNYRNGLGLDPTALPSKKLAPLLKLADRLREQTELTIPTMTLCRKVEGYGLYEPMALSFKAGQEHETIIYCEVENFSSRFSEATQHWETKLTMEAVLYNSAGDALLKGKDNVPTDQCRNRRRDFFVVKRLKLPATLAASRYILKVTIVDEQARRVAEQSLNIMMMAQ